MGRGEQRRGWAGLAAAVAAAAGQRPSDGAAAAAASFSRLLARDLFPPRPAHRFPPLARHLTHRRALHASPPAVEPNPEDPTFVSIQALLDTTPPLLVSIEKYKGCSELIRQSMARPSPETEQAAWKGVLPCVTQMKEWYDFSRRMDESAPALLSALSTDGKATLREKEALAKQLAELFSFVMVFDELKMNCPQLPNDFAFYRRMMARFPDEQVISEDDSYKMSMFFAQASPMLHTLSQTCSKLSKKDEGELLPMALAHMANVCFTMVDNQRFDSADTNMLCLRSMTACIVLYDHIAPMGAYCKKTPILVRTRAHPRALSPRLSLTAFSRSHTHTHTDQEVPDAAQGIRPGAVHADQHHSLQVGPSERRRHPGPGPGHSERLEEEPGALRRKKVPV